MVKIILQLTEDHHRINAMLNLLEQELTFLESGDDNEFDHQIVLGVFDYIKYQPDVFHHPLEELIFDRLWRYSEKQSVIERLQVDHSKLAAQTKDCQMIFFRWRQDGELFDRTRANELAKNYIDVQRAHIALEEREIFPFAIDALTEADWMEINEYAIAAAPSADPVFGPTFIERYRDIRNNIQKKLG
jgi:hemerythrin-like domain-containing protein